jgi:hypothetical protein
MSPRQSPLQTHLSHTILLAVAALLCLPLISDAGRPSVSRSLWRANNQRLRRLPRRTLWAWERPEYLQSVDANTTAVAWLDQTILIGPEVIGKPRRQPILVAQNTARIAVVRIEVRPGTPLDADTRVEDVVTLLLRSANRPAIAALQVDFDATRSQRNFYRRILRELRAQMPANLPLSITALASWCSYDDWIENLPVDEAVPMLFRMEPDRSRAVAFAPEMHIREPLCMGSVGISTREAWLAAGTLAAKRIYVFPDRGWRSDLTLLADRKLP